MEGFTREQQAYLGAIIISSASIPVFLIILIFNITNIAILDSMSSFAAGALIGDVFLHNLPEIYADEREGDGFNKNDNFFLKNQTLLGLGIIFLFAFEKIIKLFLTNISSK
jgi:zinc and cadmium transporter